MSEEQESSQYSSNTNAFKTLIKKVYIHRLPSYGNRAFYSLGFLALACLAILVATGTTMVFMGQSWWLTEPLGVYFRSIHLWTVQAFVALLVLHIMVGFFTSGFRPPRRMIWVFGAIMFFLVLIQTEFGYGLRGDFSSQYRAVSGADFWNGAHLGYLLNPLNYLQTFAIHISIIPLAIFFIFIAHYILIHSYGISRPFRKDIPYKMVKADHVKLFMRGGVLISVILTLAFFFHSPYVPPVKIADVARQDLRLVATTLLQEFDYTSDTATYFDSIDPYKFDTREVFFVSPYQQYSMNDRNNNAWVVFNSKSIVEQKAYVQEAKQYIDDVGTSDSATTTTNPVIAMLDTLLPMTKSGLYESLLGQENPSINNTYTLRFLNDMGSLDAKAVSLNMDTAQWGMAKDETGSVWKLPPGSWWLLPIGIINSTFNLLDNPRGDQIAGEILGFIILIFILFPYIPYLNQLPELLPFASFFQRDRKLPPK